MTAWLLLENEKTASGDPLLMRGDNVAAVTWATRCGRAKNKRACLLMKMLGCLQIKGGWSHVAKHIPGAQNPQADGISRWPRTQLAARVRKSNNSEDWVVDWKTRGTDISDYAPDHDHCCTTRCPAMKSHVERHRTGVTRPCSSRSSARPRTPAPLVVFVHLPRFAPRPSSPPLMMAVAGAGQNKLEDKEEVARLVERLTLGSVILSTQKHYLGKWNIWVVERAAQGKGPWLQPNPDGPSRVLTELVEFVARLCFVHNNQQSTVQGYLTAINYFHKMYAGWELPRSHCMIVPVEKGNGSRSRDVAEVGPDQAAADLDTVVAGERRNRKKYGPRKRVVGPRAFDFFVVPGFGVVGLCGRKRPSRVFPDAYLRPRGRSGRVR